MAAIRAAMLLTLVAGCDQQMDVGSNILWTARFEGNSFDEWTSVSGGGASVLNDQNIMEVSSEDAHKSALSAKLITYAPPGVFQGNVSFSRTGYLPTEAYYSAWYNLPRTVSVGVYWVIMKFRQRTVVDDASTERELFDLNLKTLGSGGMSLRVYSHQNGGGDLALSVPEDPVVPVGPWFQIEAFYRAAADSSGRLTFWLDGQQILDLRGPTGPTPWVAWDVVSVAQSLTPDTATLFVDDCAISLSRVGPSGLIAR